MVKNEIVLHPPHSNARWVGSPGRRRGSGVQGSVRVWVGPGVRVGGLEVGAQWAQRLLVLYICLYDVCFYIFPCIMYNVFRYI